MPGFYYDSVDAYTDLYNNLDPNNQPAWKNNYSVTQGPWQSLGESQPLSGPNDAAYFSPSRNGGAGPTVMGSGSDITEDIATFVAQGAKVQNLPLGDYQVEMEIDISRNSTVQQSPQNSHPGGSQDVNGQNLTVMNNKPSQYAGHGGTIRVLYLTEDLLKHTVTGITQDGVSFSGNDDGKTIVVMGNGQYPTISITLSIDGSTKPIPYTRFFVSPSINPAIQQLIAPNGGQAPPPSGQSLLLNTAAVSIPNALAVGLNAPSPQLGLAPSKVSTPVLDAVFAANQTSGNPLLPDLFAPLLSPHAVNPQPLPPGV